MLSDWYALFPDEPEAAGAAFKWPAKFPNTGKPGIYFIFDAQQSLLYVGMTTRDLNSRLGCYFGYESGWGSGCKIKDMQPTWKTRPCFVRTVAVQSLEEAPFLEKFLIQALRPPENSLF